MEKPMQNENLHAIKLQVPYFSQYLDIKKTVDGVRACGITCVKMILDYYKKSDSNLEELMNKGFDEGGFGKSGWFHDYFVKVFKDHGLDAYRKERMDDVEGIQEIVESIEAKQPVIASAERRMFSKKSFHMVLLVGVVKKENGELLGFYYNDPASTSVESGQYQYVELKDFLNYWRRMAIFVKPL